MHPHVSLPFIAAGALGRNDVSVARLAWDVHAEQKCIPLLALPVTREGADGISLGIHHLLAQEVFQNICVPYHSGTFVRSIKFKPAATGCES
jgi:hypothetical protein